ncbi:MAG: FAD-dependent monooxygenase [Paracoccaceae bacterium]
MLKGQHITIIGAGIAGLSCAIALAQRGAVVRVLEQAEKITEIGAGLQITPNGVAVMDALGLGEKLRAVGLKSETVVLRDYRRGAQVASLDMTTSGGGRPYLLVHRSDLIDLLLGAAKHAGVSIELGQQATAVVLGSGPPRVTMTHGQTDCPGLLIGADGLNSRLRQALGGAQVPFFTGQVAWRALVDGSASSSVNVHMAPGRHLVSYPLRGGAMTNIVGIQERDDKAAEGWDQSSDVEQFRAIFSDFCPEVTQLLGRVDAVNIWGLYRHPVAQKWHGNSCVLLGDAAHTTLPFLAQGANMALEDAWVLADCLDSLPVEQALPQYQQRRFDRVSRIVAAANANARNYHLRNPLVRFAAHSGLRALSAVAPGQLMARFDWVYGCDVTRA